MGNNLTDMCGPAITEKEKKELTFTGFTEEEMKHLDTELRPVFFSPKTRYFKKSRSSYPLFAIQ